MSAPITYGDHKDLIL